MKKDVDYYMSLNYKIEVEKGEEIGYVLWCPELPGCITCAETLEEGWLMIEDAKECWFASMLEDDQLTISEPYMELKASS